jgi:hypothetical protein
MLKIKNGKYQAQTLKNISFQVPKKIDIISGLNWTEKYLATKISRLAPFMSYVSSSCKDYSITSIKAHRNLEFYN